MKFKVGDRVRVVALDPKSKLNYIGKVGTVEVIHLKNGYTYGITFGKDPLGFDEYELDFEDTYINQITLKKALGIEDV